MKKETITVMNENQNTESESIMNTSGLSVSMPIYNEMNDQSAQNVNVLEMIQSQFAQIHEAQKRRQFLVKEISQFIK